MTYENYYCSYANGIPICTVCGRELPKELLRFCDAELSNAHRPCIGHPTFKPPRKNERPTECVHRGEFVKLISCASCNPDSEQAKWKVKVFRCAIFKYCSIQIPLINAGCCETCEQIEYRPRIEGTSEQKNGTGKNLENNSK
jgi:hypothetical protein